MSSLDLAVIGNCSFSALVDRKARVVWACLPRYDGDPVFCSLLMGDRGDEEGFFDLELLDYARSEQWYWRNTAVVETRLYDSWGNGVQVLDFCPRFKQHGRTFRPTSLVRQVNLLNGTPRVRVRARPCTTYGAFRPEITRGSNHLRFVFPDVTLRMTTDCSITYVVNETPFVLDRPLNMVLGPDETLPAAPHIMVRDFLENTVSYWRQWTRGLALPFEWQEAVIRAAITLKLSSYEETGGIVAAMTTSIPESEGTQRNWDYRYCWLRDSFFVVHTLNRLGATQTMESYLNYVTNIVAGSPTGYLQPLFGIALETRCDEHEVQSLPGYRNHAPVRRGNGAYVQEQNDGYGSVVLASAQSFFDRRLTHPGDLSLFRRLELLGDQAVQRWDQHDAGLWELRTISAVHTYSSVMCWCACDRLARIAKRLDLADREAHWRGHADRIHAAILERAWNDSLNSFVSTFDGDGIDASLLLLPQLGFVRADDPRFLGTLAQVERQLRFGHHLYRYVVEDDFGRPKTAFTICTFWYVDALAMVGRQDEARAVFESVLSCRNHVGLLSEGLDVETGELWGNFPQTYSMVGLIQSAMRLSMPWEEAF